MTAPVLEFTDVTVRAGGRPNLDVPRFTVGLGETVALVGPNGAGKTTLLHIAGLLRPPESGTVTILGNPATAQNGAALRRRLAVVFQDPLLFDVRVLTNTAAGVRFQGHGRADAERRAREWLARFGIAHLAERKARSLSGGEAARVALARAFATEPALLLLDEPFSALDAPTRAQLLPMLRRRLQETGTASILVTHDLEEAFAFAGHIALMDAGHIAASGNAASLVARPPTFRAAELLGIENILSAIVASVDGDRVTLRLQPVGPLVQLRVGPELSLDPGQEVVFTLPAGAVQVLAENRPWRTSGRWNCLTGRVAGITAQRSGTRLVVETPAPFVALAPWMPDAASWVIGDEATVAFAPEAGHVVLGQ